MKVIRLDDKLFAIHSPGYSRALQNAARLVPGMCWTGQVWAGRQDAIDLTARILRDSGIRVDSIDFQDVAPTARTLSLPARLYPYQRVGVEFLLREREAILADDMGLGKTLQALTAAMQVANGPGGKILIVCPMRARRVWKDEIAQNYPRADMVQMLDGRAAQAKFECGGIIICHYDILHAWRHVLRDWGPHVCIFDEGQNLSNEKTQRTRAAREVSYHAKYRWVLTGTPVPNRVSDLYSIVETARPGTFASRETGMPFFPFGLRYCNGRQETHPSRTVPGAEEKHWNFDGASRGEELRERLSYFMLRRTKTDVALELPRLTRQSIFLDTSKTLMAPNMALSRTETRRLLDVAATAKLPQVIEAAADAAREGTRVVVFCYRKAVADTIAASLAAESVWVRKHHGDVPQHIRQNAIADFRDLRSGGVFVATIDSAGDAISLSNASVCMFAELSYEPFKLLQAEARLHRIGQTLPVTIQYYLARGTIDELVAANVIAKLDSHVANVARPDGAPLQASLIETEETLLARLYASMADWTPNDAAAIDASVADAEDS